MAGDTVTDSVVDATDLATASRVDREKHGSRLPADMLQLPRKLGSRFLGPLTVIGLLYLFLISISLLGAGFKVFGQGFANALIKTTSDPFVGLFIGIIATAVIQSSSTVTSMVVAFVATGTLTVECAVPIVMGSNIGTTVTSKIVALAHLRRRGEFRRAFAAASVHDFFNIFTVLLLFPLELGTHVLQRSAEWLTTALFGSASMNFYSPIKLTTAPAVDLAKSCVASLGSTLGGTILVVFAFLLLVLSLYYLTKVMRLLLLAKIESFFRSTVGRSGLLGILLGLVITAVVQSSSVTTSLMVPMAAAGAVTLAQVYPIALGANIGTTVTALLASLACNAAGLTIALTHLLFNIAGVLMLYPIPALRRIPMKLAERLAEVGSRRRIVAVAFVLCLFFVLPGLLILFGRLW